MLSHWTLNLLHPNTNTHVLIDLGSGRTLTLCDVTMTTVNQILLLGFRLFEEPVWVSGYVSIQCGDQTPRLRTCLGLSCV